MKRVKLVIILLMVLFICGCGNNKTRVLKCSSFNEGTNMNAYGDIEYTFENDKLIKAKVDATFKDITLDNVSSVWDELKAQFSEQNPPVGEQGFKRTVSSDDKNYIFTVKMEIDYTKISKETREKYKIEDYSNKTYAELKKEASDEGYECK